MLRSVPAGRRNATRAERASGAAPPHTGTRASRAAGCCCCGAERLGLQSGLGSAGSRRACRRVVWACVQRRSPLEEAVEDAWRHSVVWAARAELGAILDFCHRGLEPLVDLARPEAAQKQDGAGEAIATRVRGGALRAAQLANQGQQADAATHSATRLSTTGKQATARGGVQRSQEAGRPETQSGNDLRRRTHTYTLAPRPTARASSSVAGWGIRRRCILAVAHKRMSGSHDARSGPGVQNPIPRRLLCKRSEAKREDRLIE